MAADSPQTKETESFLSRHGTTLIAVGAGLVLLLVVYILFRPSAGKSETVSGEASNPGWSVRYNATIAQARRGSPRTNLSIVEEMLDEPIQRANFSRKLENGQRTVDENAVFQLISETLKVVVIYAEKSHDWILGNFVGFNLTENTIVLNVAGESRSYPLAPDSAIAVPALNRAYSRQKLMAAHAATAPGIMAMQNQPLAGAATALFLVKEPRYDAPVILIIEKKNDRPVVTQIHQPRGAVVSVQELLPKIEALTKSDIRPLRTLAEETLEKLKK